jgi:hypothetical protein
MSTTAQRPRLIEVLWKLKQELEREEGVYIQFQRILRDPDYRRMMLENFADRGSLTLQRLITQARELDTGNALSQASSPEYSEPLYYRLEVSVDPDRRLQHVAAYAIMAIAVVVMIGLPWLATNGTGKNTAGPTSQSVMISSTRLPAAVGHGRGPEARPATLEESPR